jgi:hypothetical protein
LKRAAVAIREARSGDCIVLARKGLEAAIRNENDLLALLPDDLPATSTPQRATEKNGAQPTHAAAQAQPRARYSRMREMTSSAGSGETNSLR